MMFRSLFFIAPLVASDEQTAMLQLNRRGEVSSHSLNDALVGSLEHSLMSKEPEKPSEHAMCTYYLKSDPKHTTLLQKIAQLKGDEKTQQLLQRAMDSIGEQNLRSLEENLMSKDDDKKEDKKVEEEKKLTPCQVLIELRNAFKDHMHNEREVANKIRETGHKVGEMVEDIVKKSLDAALSVLNEGKTLDEAKVHLKEINLKQKLKEIQEHRRDEVEKSLEAIENAIPKLKGSEMQTTFNTSKTALKDAVTGYENVTIHLLDNQIKGMMTSMTLPVAPGYTDADVQKVFADIQTNMASDHGKAKEALNTGIGYVKKFIDHQFEKQANNTWKAFSDFWSNAKVLATDSNVTMKTPPENIGDDLFWEQAAWYLEKDSVPVTLEAPCLATAFDKNKAGEFAPRKICDGADLKCADEFLYLAKKNNKVAKTQCEEVEKADIPNDTKVSDKKITDKFPFLAKADGKTCEKWEKIKDACKSIKKM